MEHIIKNSNLIFDVGMLKGEDTDYYLKKGFQVIAFEANPDLMEECAKRFCNEIQNGQLIIVSGALVDSAEKEVKFFKNDINSCLGTVVTDWVHRQEFDKIITVQNYVSIESERVEFNLLIEELDIFRQLGFGNFKAINQAEVPSQKEPFQSAEGRYIGYCFDRDSSGLFGRDLPGKWKTYEEIIKEYKLIFFLYSIFGDNGLLKNRIGSKRIKKILEKILKRRIPGWYDLHASLS